jgi:DNA polymerase-1
VHRVTAAAVAGIHAEEVTKQQRERAKATNFGIMYGQGAFGLAGQLGISRGEAQDIINSYFEKYAGIKRYIDDTIASTRDRGYATTVLGRRRYFPTIMSNNRGLRTAAERAAINMPIQGTAADMMKIAMVRVHDRMRSEGCRSILMLQVHDELVFECPADEVEQISMIAREEMQQALPINGVPIIVETGVGESWYEAH